MPIMSLPANMRALCGFYALGKRVTETPAPETPWSPSQGRYLLAPGPNLRADYWSHSESTLIADGQMHIFEFRVPEITKVESVHAFGFCMLDCVLIGNERFPSEHQAPNPALWLLTPSRSLMPLGRVRVIVRGIIKHFGIQDDTGSVASLVCANCGHDGQLHGPRVGCMVLNCDCMQCRVLAQANGDTVSPPVEAP
jgi:hypothetical protein